MWPKELILRQVFNHSIPICITNTKYEIIEANDAYWQFWGKPKTPNTPIQCYDSRPGETCHTEHCPVTQIIKGADEYTYEPTKIYNGKLYNFVVTAKPLLDENNRLIGTVEYFHDVTELRKSEQVKSDLIQDLEDSLREANLLSGFLPICASCKKIRNDKGFWDQIEEYITKHSQAKFTHSICPDCARELYPDFNFNKDKEK